MLIVPKKLTTAAELLAATVVFVLLSSSNASLPKCDEGHYLNKTSGNCIKCAPGSYNKDRGRATFCARCDEVQCLMYEHSFLALYMHLVIYKHLYIYTYIPMYVLREYIHINFVFICKSEGLLRQYELCNRSTMYQYAKHHLRV